MNFDDGGLIVQTDSDGGDCAARSGTLILGLKISDRLGININTYVTPKLYWKNVKDRLLKGGAVLRYDRPPYNNPKDVPADQYMPLVMAAHVMGDYDMCQSMWEGLASNEFRFPNGDPCGPQDFIVWNPSNWLGSVQLYIGALLRCYQARDPDDVGDDIRLTETLAFLKFFYGKDTSALSVYKRRRPKGVQYAWDHYFRPETHANPLNELWRPIIGRL